MKNRGRYVNIRAFTLAEIMVTVAIIALLAALVLPNFMRGNLMAQANVCIANLKIMDQAKMLWSQDTGAFSSSVPTWSDLVNNYIKKTPSCPSGGSYTIGSVSSAPTCTEVSGIYPHRLE